MISAKKFFSWKLIFYWPTECPGNFCNFFQMVKNEKDVSGKKAFWDFMVKRPFRKLLSRWNPHRENVQTANPPSTLFFYCPKFFCEKNNFEGGFADWTFSQWGFQRDNHFLSGLLTIKSQNIFALLLSFSPLTFHVFVICCIALG